MNAAATVPALRDRLAALTAILGHGLVERGREVRLLLLAALAGEHTLLVGPPGTAKSELARRLHLAFRDARYFERLLTRFSVPEELFGPLSIAALEQDRYERQTAGFLPEAGIAFIEAFFDRFLLRLPVAPVSGGGFVQLLALDGLPALPAFAPLEAADLAALDAAAGGVTLDPEVIGLLAELRERQTGAGVYVSDRRWVKIVHLLKVAAATEARLSVCLWDLWLLPWCTAANATGQQAVADWLAGRLGVRAACSPPRLTRVVEAFEAQASLEQEAEDLDYDEDGRLKFSAELEARVSDAKGAAEALRMSFRKQRRYGSLHIAARLGQLDDLAARLDGYRQELADYRAGLAAYRAGSLWLEPAFADRAEANLAATAEALAALRDRLGLVRARFEALPRLPVDPGTVPEPVVHEALAP